MTKTVNVTASDIAHGKASDCEHCPIARAVRRLVKGWGYVSVGAWYVSFAASADSLNAHDARMPQEATDFIVAYDGGQGVEPFSFTLDVPEPAAA
jgi:hypothetical protein